MRPVRAQVSFLGDARSSGSLSPVAEPDCGLGDAMKAGPSLFLALIFCSQAAWAGTPAKHKKPQAQSKSPCAQASKTAQVKKTCGLFDKYASLAAAARAV